MALTFCVVLDNGHSHMDLAWVSLWGGADGVEPWSQKGQVGEEQTSIQTHTWKLLKNLLQVWISQVLPLLILMGVL